MAKKTETKKKYSASFILNTRGYEDPVDTIIEKLKKEIGAAGGEVIQAENLGHKDFLRITDKKHTGDFYIQIDYSGHGDCASTLHKNLELDKTVKRILIQSQS